MGVEVFNAASRRSVLQYTREWRDYVTRQARWVDFDNDYKTLDTTFMESVLWAFKRLYDKGLAYEGYRVLPYCWKDETPLSNHELRMDDDVYKMRQDQTVTVTFPLIGTKAEALGLTAVRALAWTTTPWTLPTNLALAVGPDIEYSVVPSGPNGTPDAEVHGRAGAGSDDPVDRRRDASADEAALRRLGENTEVLGAEYLLASDLVGGYAKDLGYDSADEARAAVSRTVRGRDLEGVEYARLWDYYADVERWGTQNAWRILVADYVSTTDGTGIVHQAPAYGEEDQRVCEAAGIPVIISVDDGGRFLSTVRDVEGMHVFDANKPLTQMLKADGRLIRQASYEHSYPHCWRCRNPLIYKAVSSWFVRVTEFRDRMEQLNQEIEWVPENVKDGQFGKWVSGARDWSISRNRYWGSPIPVWKSDDPNHPRIDVYGSLEELERDFGTLPRNRDGEPDLHSPFIDELTRPNPDDPTGRSTMRRIDDVFDVWFDSGSMPFAQVHYPFENEEWFATHSPADFIVEYIGQTRGWFYVMHALSTALFDRPAFKNVISHGIVLGSDGQKMSKSLRNYPDVNEVFDRDGSDAMRWFLMASPILRGGNLIVTEQGIREGVRQVLLPLWNTYSFLALYAPKVGTWRTDSAHVLDRYILAKLAALRDDLTTALDECDISGACEQLRQFAEALTNWYVRRSRSRFWEEDPDAIDTLHTVLEVTTRLAAPLLPLTTEVIWRGITGGRSVHLTDWPEADALPKDPELVAAMDRVREVCSAASSLRKAKKLRVRLPLPKLTVAVDNPKELDSFADLIADELNVKTVELTDDIATYGRFELTVNARAAGPRLGKAVQGAIKAVKAGEGVLNPDGTLTAGEVVLNAGEYSSKLVAADEEYTAALPGGVGLVVLDGTVTPELEAEGWAKDRIRELQDLRKSSGLDVSDRITVVMSVPPARAEWARTHRDLIAHEILATSFAFGEPADPVEIGDGVRVAIAKA